MKTRDILTLLVYHVREKVRVDLCHGKRRIQKKNCLMLPEQNFLDMDTLMPHCAELPPRLELPPVIHKVLETFHATDEQKQNALNQHETDRAFEKDNTMHPILNFVFENLEDVKLLLFCSQGTKYENILDKAAKMESDATWRMMEEAGYPPMSEQDKETLFLLMRHQYQTYAEAIRLDFSKERTAAYWKAIRDFYDAGWHKFLNS